MRVFNAIFGLAILVNSAIGQSLPLLSRRNKTCGNYSGNVEACPGYRLKEPVIGWDSFSAKLELAGEACNAYGIDLKDLVLKVSWENGKPDCFS